MDRVARRGGPKFWTVLDQALVSGSNFVLTLLLFRLLGIDNFGVYALFFVVLTIAQTIHHSAVSTPMMSILPGPEAAAHEREIAHFLVFHLIVNLPLSLAATAALRIAAGPAIGPVEAVATFLALALFQFHDFVRRYLFSAEKAFYGFLADGLRYLSLLVAVGLALALLPGEQRVALALWLAAAASFLSVLLMGGMVLRAADIGAPGLRAALARYARLSSWLGFSGALQVLSSSIFYLVAGGLLTPAAAGILRASQTATSILPVMQQGLETYVPMRAAQHFRAAGRAGLAGFLRQSFLQAFAFALIVGLLLVTFADPLMALLFPGDLAGTNLVFWFVVIALVEVLVSYIRFYFRSVLDVAPVFWASAASALVAMGLVYPLVSQMGLVGAALGILAARIALLSVLALFLVRRWRRPV
jgi:Membrane protein involved in the export of O-antigen and teichoic acid